VVETTTGRFVAPSLVVARVRAETLDTPEHRRIARFVGRLWREADAVAKSGVIDRDHLATVLTAQELLRETMSTTLFGDVSPAESEDLVLEPTGVELNDARYGALHELRSRYLTEVVPMSSEGQLERQHTARPDEVFQALCTLLLAAAFGLTRRTGGAQGERWESEAWTMYCNREGILPSWRAETERPDDYRPDFVLLRSDDPSRCILLDAKASVDPAGRVPGGRLKEVQAYLNAFGVYRAGILYPGPMNRARSVESTDISAHGYQLRELPVRPVEPTELAVMLESLRQRVEELEDVTMAEDA
jgi:hypothetical protein